MANNGFNHAGEEYGGADGSAEPVFCLSGLNMSDVITTLTLDALFPCDAYSDARSWYTSSTNKTIVVIYSLT